MQKEPLSDMVNSQQTTNRKGSSQWLLYKKPQQNSIIIYMSLIRGGRLSSDSGLALVDEFMDAFHFTEHSKDVVSFNEDRRYWLHDNHKILKQLLFQIIAGYKADLSVDILQYDPLLQTLSTDEVWASQPSISRFFDRITE